METVVTIGVGVVILLLVAGIRGIFNMNVDMNSQFGKLNGTMEVLQKELSDHIKADDKREARVDKNIDDLWTQKVDKA